MAGLQSVTSMWKLKSPRRRTVGEMAHNWVRKSAKSGRKAGFGLAGGSLNNSSDEWGGTRKFEGDVFEGESSRNGNGSCCNVVVVDCSNSATPPLRTRFFHIRESSLCGLI